MLNLSWGREALLSVYSGSKPHLGGGTKKSEVAESSPRPQEGPSLIEKKEKREPWLVLGWRQLQGPVCVDHTGVGLGAGKLRVPGVDSITGVVV